MVVARLSVASEGWHALEVGGRRLRMERRMGPAASCEEVKAGEKIEVYC